VCLEVSANHSNATKEKYQVLSELLSNKGLNYFSVFFSENNNIY
jgi:hypothetical protein